MPELPDVTVYVESIDRHVTGQILTDVRIPGPFLLRTVDPPPSEASGRRVVGVHRIGKRIVLELEQEIFLVIHLMIAGRLKWLEPGARVPRKLGQAAFDFPHGTLLFTEAGTRKRASLHVVRGREALREFERGGVDLFRTSGPEFLGVMRSENHTLKRFLTDPRLVDGVGNAYSDEILHRARLSPLRLTSRMTDEEGMRLLECARETMREWIERLRAETGGGFPGKVTAFRKEMAVHGKYAQPCPDCGNPVQRIVYSGNETNYCAACQTEGRLLADRALSRLLRSDWPKTLEELEDRRTPR